MKLSFDYDGTLSKNIVQIYAKELISQGHEVYITTARWDSVDKYSTEDKKEWQIINLPKAHQKLFDIADKIGISRQNIHFTNKELKFKYIRSMDFLWHLDDDWKEIDAIRDNNTGTIGVRCFGGNDWNNECDKIINDYEIGY